MQDNFDDEPSSLHLLLALLQKSGTTGYSGVLFPVHTRLHCHLFAMVEAMTEQSGLSRNKLVNRILEVGIDTTLKSLSPEVVEELRVRAGEITHKALVKGDKKNQWESGIED